VTSSINIYPLLFAPIAVMRQLTVSR